MPSIPSTLLILRMSMNYIIIYTYYNTRVVIKIKGLVANIFKKIFIDRASYLDHFGKELIINVSALFHQSRPDVNLSRSRL